MKMPREVPDIGLLKIRLLKIISFVDAAPRVTEQGPETTFFPPFPDAADDRQFYDDSTDTI